MAAEEQLARVLGPDWERMSWVQAAAFGRGRPLIDFAAEPQQPAGAKVRSIGNRPTHSQRRFYRSATPGNQRTNRKRTGRIAVVVPTEGDTRSRLSKGLMRRFLRFRFDTNEPAAARADSLVSRSKDAL